jgi:hypothetical protein
MGGDFSLLSYEGQTSESGRRMDGRKLGARNIGEDV